MIDTLRDFVAQHNLSMNLKHDASKFADFKWLSIDTHQLDLKQLDAARTEFATRFYPALGRRSSRLLFVGGDDTRLDVGLF